MTLAQIASTLPSDETVSALAESPLLTSTSLPARGGGQAVPAPHMANAPAAPSSDDDPAGRVEHATQVIDAGSDKHDDGGLAVDAPLVHHAAIVGEQGQFSGGHPTATALLPSSDPDGLGHLWSGDRTPGAESVPDVQPGEDVGPASGAAHPSSAGDLALLHASMGHYGRVLLDVQKLRLAMGNRVGAMERDGLPEEWIAVSRAQLDMLAQSERDLTNYLKRQAKRHPLAPWIEQQRGIGLPGFARLLGITGPLSRFATVSKLWRYLGLAVDDGQAPRRRKGERLNYSPAGRVLCRQIAESIVKMGKGGEYRQVYDDKKSEYETSRPDWTPAHRHAAAMRFAVKRLIRRLWCEWRRLEREGVL